VTAWLEDFRHLTWNGRAAMLWLPVRRLLLAPAATEDRCIMGTPVSDRVWCPRRALHGELWCRRHVPNSREPT
jgi:hypothetical protein